MKAKGIKKDDRPITMLDCHRIIMNMDFNANMSLNYKEFIVATIDKNWFADNLKIDKLFQFFDIDDTKFITKENFDKAMVVRGKKYKDICVMKCFENYNNKRITLKEFQELLFLEKATF